MNYSNCLSKKGSSPSPYFTLRHTASRFNLFSWEVTAKSFVRRDFHFLAPLWLLQCCDMGKKKKNQPTQEKCFPQRKKCQMSQTGCVRQSASQGTKHGVFPNRISQSFNIVLIAKTWGGNRARVSSCYAVKPRSREEGQAVGWDPAERFVQVSLCHCLFAFNETLMFPVTSCGLGCLSLCVYEHEKISSSKNGNFCSKFHMVHRQVETDEGKKKE